MKKNNTDQTAQTLYTAISRLPKGVLIEIAEQVGCHRNTVYNTLKKGMNGKNSQAIKTETQRVIDEYNANSLRESEARVKAAREALEAEILAANKLRQANI